MRYQITLGGACRLTAHDLANLAHVLSRIESGTSLISLGQFGSPGEGRTTWLEVVAMEEEEVDGQTRTGLKIEQRLLTGFEFAHRRQSRLFL